MSLGYTLIALEEATERELELAQRHEDERWKITFGEPASVSSVLPLRIIGPDADVLPSDDELPF